MRKGKVFYKDLFAGMISEEESGYIFAYEKEYIKLKEAKPISLTLPLKREPYKSSFMFPFFDGLIPEGWLLDIAEKNWKIDQRDRMGLLLAFCKDCIGAVSVIPMEE
jgi:serine/threonine-protein kinase HipA